MDTCLATPSLHSPASHPCRLNQGTKAPPLTHAHSTHAGRGVLSTPHRPQTHAGLAHRCTHMLSLDTNLAGELTTTWWGGGRKRKGKEDRAVRVRFELGMGVGNEHWDHL
jgi:hypothetical protein